MKNNYYECCYIALYWTLEHILLQSKKPIVPHPFSLCDLLSNMCPFTFSASMSADPASYYDYEQILKNIISDSGEETALNGYAAGRKYLQMYIAEYAYDLEEVIDKFSLDTFSLAYEKATAGTANET